MCCLTINKCIWYNKDCIYEILLDNKRILIKEIENARSDRIWIGFVTGRPNVCKIINSYYEYLIEQTKDLNKK